MSLTIGQSVGGYDLLDYLDSSSRRIAYRARNQSNQRIEQLLILPEGLRKDPEWSARFFRESRIMSSLSHPNILSSYGAVEIGGHLAIAVEALEAVTLSERLELGPMDIEDAVRTVLQVLAATDAAHSAGVLHREISPANILITPERTAKLAGFSSAKSTVDTNLTRAGSLVSDVTYTAPEIFQGYTALDPRIDVYAIGCVFYALVTGQPPFPGKSEYEVMMAHVGTVPTPPSHINPLVNPVLDAVILRALSKDPNARYQTAREFYHCVLNPGTVYQPPPEPVENTHPVPAPARIPSAEIRMGPAVAAIGLGLFFLGAALWVLARSGAG